MGVAIVTIVVMAAVVAAVVVWSGRPIEETGSAAAPPRRPEPKPAPGPGDIVHDFGRVRPPVDAFHVRGDQALVYFNVPLASGEVDQVMSDLLIREAVEVLREKRSHDLPISDVVVVKAFAQREGEPVEAGSLDLEEPGELPSIEAFDLIPHASSTGFDPLAELDDEALAGMAPGLADSRREKGLADLGDELRLTSALEAGLRAQGVDPATMRAGDLAMGLLRLGGYNIGPGTKAGTFVATRGGARTFLRVVDHEKGEYPELDEKFIDEFIIGFNQSGADRGLLITDKYGPFIVYEKERRAPRVRFITRERLQAFVDSFATT